MPDCTSKPHNLVAKHVVVNSEKEVIKIYGDPESLRWLAGELLTGTFVLLIWRVKQ